MKHEPSLKTILQTFNGPMGVGIGTLYEHQCNLVRSGLLKSRPGRGPGSGVEGTLDNLMIFFVTFAASRKPQDIVRMENAVIEYVRSRQ